MEPRGSTPDVRSALDELVEYLCDRSVPLMVTEAVETLLDQPVELTAELIGTWVAGQRDIGTGATRVSDYLHHAVKKIAQLGEFQLIEMDRLRPFLIRLAEKLDAYCPPLERESFLAGLRSIGRSDGSARGGVSVLYRAPESLAAAGSAVSQPVAVVPEVARMAGTPLGLAIGAVPAPATPATAPVTARAGPLGGLNEAALAESLQRFSLLLERLTAQQVPASAHAATAGAPANDAIVAEALKTAALGSRNAGELDHALKQLAGLGVDASMQQVVRGLAGALPQWLVDSADDAETDDWKDNRAMAALHRVVTTAPDPPEAGRRFFEVLTQAVELFNQGDLGRALAAARIVRRLIVTREVAAGSSDLMLRRAAATVSAERLQALAANPMKQPHVRRFLELFPSLAVAELLGLLAEEPDRQRRKVLLATIEAWGAPARSAIVGCLLEVQRGEVSDPHGYVQRNLVYLLRRIPPGDTGWRDDEIEAVRVASDPAGPLVLVREAIRALGRIPHEKAARALVQRLGQVERALIDDPRSLPYPPADGVTLLDRIVEALARTGQVAAFRAIEAHSRRREPALGGCLARIEALHAVDLSGDATTVQRILERIHADLPGRIAAFALGGKSERITPLVVALGSTRTREVLELMGQLAQRFPAEPYGVAAQAVVEQRTVPSAAARRAGSDQDDLTAHPAAPVRATGPVATATAAAPAAPAAAKAPGTQRTIAGDLDIFGLPSLLQNLGMSKLSGTLVLSDAAGRPYARLTLDRGAFVQCTMGHLVGHAALYQIFESGLGGHFEFTSTDAADAQGEPGPDVTSLIFEGLRRVDELQLLRALVPDSARLAPTGTKPTVVPDEDDTALTRKTWTFAVAGRPIVEVEAQLPVDTYRARRMFAYWIEKGALAISS